MEDTKLRVVQQSLTLISYFAMTLLLVVLGLSFWVASLFFQLGSYRKIINCGSFDTYAQALQAYNGGDKKLDHNGNGIPCESLVI